MLCSWLHQLFRVKLTVFHWTILLVCICCGILLRVFYFHYCVCPVRFIASNHAPTSAPGIDAGDPSGIDAADPELGRFAVPMTIEDAIMFQQTLRVFDEAMTSANISYFIFGGTLIGSYRHHGRIPWDDDADVIVNSSDEPAVQRVLSNFNPHFRVYAPGRGDRPYYMKFYPANGHSLKAYPYRSPFLDIFLFKENKTHVWNISPYFTREMFAKRDVFPLVRRPFGDLMLQAPCNPLRIFEATGIELSVCRTSNWDHLAEKGAPASVEIPCSRLVRMYPFVDRGFETNRTAEANFTETLVLGRLVLNQFSTTGVC